MKKRVLLTFILVLALLLCASAVVIGVSASESEPTLEVKSGALALKDSVEMLFLVSYDGVAPEDVELLIWTGSNINVAGCEKGNEEYAITSKEYNTNTKEIVFRFGGLAAAEMTKNVYAKVYADGKYSEPFKYSIVEYAYNMLAKDTTAPALKQVLIDMLVYGASAQNYFNPGDGAPLASAVLGKVILNGAVLADGMTHGLFPVGSEITLTAPTTEELPYATWIDKDGKIISAAREFSYTVLAGDNNLTVNLSRVQSSFGLYEHVVIIGVDGAGAFPTSEEFGTATPNIDRIFADGAVTGTMRVASPTSSAASWGAMLHGSLPYQNGIFDNAPVEAVDAEYPINSKFPSFLKHIVDTDAASKVAVYSGWSGITNGILENDELSGVMQTRASDADNLISVKNYIADNKDFKALFYQINNPDAMGHNHDYNSKEYYEAIETADSQIGEVYAALEAAGILDKTLFIVTADHGGTSRLVSGSPDGTGTHGGLSDVEKYTMFAVAGYTVEENGIPEDVHIRDIASVALYALGIEQPASYSSRVPSGVFNGITAGERPVYNDPDNPRDFVSQSTPPYTGSSFKVGGVDNALWYYLPFDNTLDELVNENTTSTAKGTISYESGYFGDAVVLDDGHVVMDNFATGTESFTVSMWVKSAGPDGVPPIVASRDRSVGTNPGFLVAMRRFATAQKTEFTLEWSYSNGKGAPDSYSNPYVMPDDFSRGWMHVVVIFNKEAGTVSAATDFGEFKTWSVPNYVNAEANIDTAVKKLVFGNDLSENYSSKMGLSIDEFMIFHGALDRNDVNRLAEYYGQDGVPTIYDALGFDPTLELNFNNNLGNTGSQSSELTEGNVQDFVDSPFGTAADFTGADGVRDDGTNSGGSSPEHYVQYGDFKACTGDGTSGYNSVTFSMWLQLSDAITSNTGDKVLFATGDSDDREHVPGISVLMYGAAVKIKEADLPVYIKASDCTFDADGYAMRNGEYIYRQLIVVRATAEVYKSGDSGDYANDNITTYIYATPGQWSHLVFVYDRGEYGVNDGAYRLYQDGECILSAAMNDKVEDYADFNGQGLMINDDVGHVKKSLNIHLDEFTVFDRALTEEELAALYEYYESIRD